MRKKEIVDENFYQINQNLFRDFLKSSVATLSGKGEFEEIEPIVGSLEALGSVNIAESVASASHKVYGKDLKILKGLIIGGAISGVASIFLGPVIGTYIGNLAGFSGAAATSYGLALLGGGSLASGGLGMAGGSLILGLGFGIKNGVSRMKKASEDELNRAQARVVLPLLLALGKIQLEVVKDRRIPELIHSTIGERLKELRGRLGEQLGRLKDSGKAGDKNRVECLKETVELYENAKAMSKSYDWFSGYDLLSGVKKWAS